MCWIWLGWTEAVENHEVPSSKVCTGVVLPVSDQKLTSAADLKFRYVQRVPAIIAAQKMAPDRVECIASRMTRRLFF